MSSRRLQTRLSHLEQHPTAERDARKPRTLTPETAHAIRVELLGFEAPAGYVPTFTPEQRASLIERILFGALRVDERTSSHSLGVARRADAQQASASSNEERFSTYARVCKVNARPSASKKRPLARGFESLK